MSNSSSENEDSSLSKNPERDSLAERVDHSPLKKGGTNFRTRKLVRNGRNYELKATFGSLLFGGIFFAMGIIVAIVMGLGLHEEGGSPFMAIVPLVFSVFGFFMLKSFLTPVVFDGRNKLFYRGKNDPSQSMRNDSKTEVIAFDQIHALQIISEYVHSSGENSSSFYSYELNIIKEDGSRYNVMDHGNRRKLYEDARELARFLKVPLWE